MLRRARVVASMSAQGRAAPRRALRVSIRVDPDPCISIGELCADLCEFAARLGVTVEAPWNGAIAMAVPSDTPEHVERELRAALSRNEQIARSARSGRRADKI